MLGARILVGSTSRNKEGGRTGVSKRKIGQQKCGGKGGMLKKEEERRELRIKPKYPK